MAENKQTSLLSEIKNAILSIFREQQRQGQNLAERAAKDIYQTDKKKIAEADSSGGGEQAILGGVQAILGSAGKVGAIANIIVGVLQKLKKLANMADTLTGGAISQRAKKFEVIHEGAVDRVRDLVVQYAALGMKIPVGEQIKLFDVARARQNRVLTAQREIDARFARFGGLGGFAEDQTGFAIARWQELMRQWVQNIYEQQGRGSLNDRLQQSLRQAERNRQILENQKVHGE